MEKFAVMTMEEIAREITESAYDLGEDVEPAVDVTLPARAVSYTHLDVYKRQAITQRFRMAKVSPRRRPKRVCIHTEGMSWRSRRSGRWRGASPTSSCLLYTSGIFPTRI